ncbi:MAG: uroporphyrinogen decarboxylase family protein [Candidatus Omnitrophota bacterium]
MQSQDIVRRAIEFQCPPRLPFFQHVDPDAPDDVWDIWEMDRAQAGWFFDNAAYDDWGCGWERTEIKTMGQVVVHPLADSQNIDRYYPPEPRNPFYYERIEPLLSQANSRYVVVTCHFTLLERLHMLRGFAAAMEGFYADPEITECILDWILEFKLAQIEELRRRFGNAIHGIFLTDDWGTQQGLIAGLNVFERFFASRYRRLFDAIHANGWHVFLHSCGKINALVPRFIELGVDVLNMQQPNAYGLVEFGEKFKGKVCFLTTVDIQTTLPRGIEAEVREEARLLVHHWSVKEGGFIVFNYGDPQSLGVREDVARIMFQEFVKHMQIK